MFLSQAKKATRRSPGDKGYVSSDLFESLLTKGIKLITLVARFLIFDQESHTTLDGIKKTMKNKLMIMEEKIFLKKRSVIESVFNIIKNHINLNLSRSRSRERREAFSFEEWKTSSEVGMPV